jgi:hypothetical protein
LPLSTKKSTENTTVDTSKENSETPQDPDNKSNLKKAKTPVSESSKKCFPCESGHEASPSKSLEYDKAKVDASGQGYLFDRKVPYVVKAKDDAT